MLRIAFGTSNLMYDDHTSMEGFNSAMLSVAFALKHAWESNESAAARIIPIPRESRREFGIEFVGFTEDILKFTTLSAGGTEEASAYNAMPGTLAMVGALPASLASSLQLRQTSPAGQPVHAVIGNYMSVAGEEALAKMGGQFLTPVIGFGFQDAKFADRTQFPYYIRTNRVALDPGMAIAKLFQELNYSKIFLVQAAKTARVEEQLRAMIPHADIVVDGPSKEIRGACGGQSTTCVDQNLQVWQRMRSRDARVIVHEIGGSTFELLLAIGNDLIGEKTFYIQSGLDCQYINFFSYLSDAFYYGSKICYCKLCPCCNSAA